jgi:hypothetical protein
MYVINPVKWSTPPYIAYSWYRIGTDGKLVLEVK